MLRPSQAGVLLSALGFAAIAMAQSPLPTDIELRAAYCIPVIQNDIKTLERIRVKNSVNIEELKQSPQNETQKPLLPTLQEIQVKLSRDIAGRETVLDRLQLFLLPRQKYLDSAALLGAISRADSDMQEWFQVTRKCMLECMQAAKSELTEICSPDCGSGTGDLKNRLDACRNPTWLPF